MRIAGNFQRRRRLSLTSLIDVIFLLLLFFMLSSTFTRFAEVELSGGRAGSGAGAPDILLRIDGENWTVNGIDGDADAAMSEMARLERSGAKRAVLMVTQAASAQDLVSAVERIRRDTALALDVAG